MHKQTIIEVNIKMAKILSRPQQSDIFELSINHNPINQAKKQEKLHFFQRQLDLSKVSYIFILKGHNAHIFWIHAHWLSLHFKSQRTQKKR